MLIFSTFVDKVAIGIDKHPQLVGLNVLENGLVIVVSMLLSLR